MTFTCMSWLMHATVAHMGMYTYIHAYAQTIHDTSEKYTHIIHSMQRAQVKKNILAIRQWCEPTLSEKRQCNQVCNKEFGGEGEHKDRKDETPFLQLCDQLLPKC